MDTIRGEDVIPITIQIAEESTAAFKVAIAQALREDIDLRAFIRAEVRKALKEALQEGRTHGC